MLESAARAAAARTNANAARVTDAIIVAAKPLGVTERIVKRHPITGEPLYATMTVFTTSKWDPDDVGI